MQTIVHKYKNIHPIFDQFDRLYALTSVKQNRNTLLSQVFHTSFASLIELFHTYGKTNYQVNLTGCHVGKLTAAKRKKVITVCFSGGKDSLATALYYEKKGYVVFLYHLHGINKTYKDEDKAAKQLAQKAELPLHIEDITLTGNQDWVEHPMKNMIIANQALQWSITQGYGTDIAFGNFSTSTLLEDPFDVCGGDCREMWQAYEEIIDNIIPGFHIHTPLENFQSTIDILLEHKDLIHYTQSCIGPYRYREYLRTNNMSKYKIQLPAHRCGSCWKCCLEYIIFCDNDVYEYNEKYYKHCLKILQNTLYKETHRKYNLDETWEHYVFYDKNKSKYFDKIP